MKRLLLIVSILLPALLNAQPKPGQKNKSIFEFLRPLHGDADNFEKGLAHHNQTFHNGKDPVDIYEELTGDQTVNMLLCIVISIPGVTLKIPPRRRKTRTTLQTGIRMWQNTQNPIRPVCFMK